MSKSRFKYWCMWCGRKQVRYLNVCGSPPIPKFKCVVCNMTYLCYKKDLDVAVPLEVQKEIEEDIDEI